MVDPLDNIPTHHTSNAQIIFTYSENMIRAQIGELTGLNYRLTALLALAGVELKMVVDLKTWTLPACFSVLAGLAAIVWACKGLFAKPGSPFVSIDNLMSDEWYEADEEKLRCYIINTWARASKQINDIGHQRSIAVNCGIGCVIVGFAGYLIALANSNL